MIKKLLHFGRRAESQRPVAGTFCHNCHAAVSTTFCGECGQKAAVHIASAHEFIHHFIGHYVAAEGKLWATLRQLLLRPGQLTLEFIGGRRGRYIDPLRLLLTISLLAFLAMKLAGLLTPTKTEPPPSAQTKSAPAAATALPKLWTWQVPYYLAERSSPDFTRKFTENQALPPTQRTAYFWNIWLKSGPTIILCLVPIIAVLLKLLHLGTGWRFGEHLVFAIHLQCFTMLGFMAWVIAADHSKTLAMLPLAITLLYSLVAMFKVYRGGWLVLLARWVALVYLEFKVFTLFVVSAVMYSLT